MEEIPQAAELMEIVIDRPPIYDRAAKVFPLEGREIFAYGDKIYNPGGFVVPAWLVAHEEVHQLQQAGEPEAWWDQYLVDAEFRFHMELAAHRREYESYCEHNKDRNKRLQYKRIVAKKLSAPLYGNMITRFDAMRSLT